MIGLQYIADTFYMEYTFVAEKIGVSKQTLQDWIKGRRKIPQQRLEQLSKLFGIKETDLFQKKDMTDSEKTDIQILYFRQTDVIEEVELPLIVDGEEYTTTHTFSQNQDVIQFLNEKREKSKLLEHIAKTVDFEHYDGKDKKILFDQLLAILEGTKNQRRSIELVLYALTEYKSDWGVRPQFAKFRDKGFFEKFNSLLEEYGLSDN